MALGWDALTAFSMAGFMTASGAAGVEVVRLGGRPILNLVLGVLSGLGLVMLWLVFMMAVQAHVAG